MTASSGHRVVVDWMGNDVETLADLLPQSPRAVCVGINPAPPSVAAGHYFQGRQGQRFYARLRQAGLIRPTGSGFEDDDAVAAGIGFTDVVKRPTARSDDVPGSEMRYGVELLRARLEAVRAPVLLFPFKRAAVAVVGTLDGNGWLDRTFAGADLFVMPGPYEAAHTANATIARLAERLR
ncbi:MAG: uracil-DNA glycosylase family protein [Actinomycetota bacterium]